MNKSLTWVSVILFMAAGAFFGLVGAADGAAQANPGAQAVDQGLPQSYNSMMSLPVSFEPRNVKRGFDQKAEPELIQPDNDGTIRIEIREVGCVEIELGKGQIYRGYSIVGDQLRPLPIGSTLDQRAGAFYWMPGPGFLGTYDLVFMRKDGYGVVKRIPVQVTVKPKYEPR